jgi:hypothetical protein
MGAIGVRPGQLIADNGAAYRADNGAGGSVVAAGDRAANDSAHRAARDCADNPVAVLLFAGFLSKGDRWKEGGERNARG